MASTSGNDTSKQEKEAALNRALDERTDPIKLQQCTIDLRCHRICPESWWENRALPRLYAISVSCNETIVDM
jgi:hypothetical protein